MKKFAIASLLLVVFLTACNLTPPPAGGGDYIYLADYHILVDSSDQLVPQSSIADLSGITYTVKPEHKDNIVIYKNVVYGLKGGTESEVTATVGGVSCTFKVEVAGARQAEADYTGSLFNPVTVEPVEGLRADFAKGVDISSLSEVVKRGGKFYNAEGYPESALLQLKNAGVNYIRVRLWNDPVAPNGSPYGGGNNDIEVAKSIAAPAKALGLKFVLCLHYSDSWADPGKQVMPKAWLNISTSDEMAATIKEFTKSTIAELAEAGAEPDMVQIGNEITGGMLRHVSQDYNDISNTSKYTEVNSKVAAVFGSDNLIKYLKAGVAGAKEASPSIEIMIHIDRGGNNTVCKQFFNFLKDNEVPYDIIGLSYYTFYHGSVSNFAANILSLEESFGKKIIVAETSYAFTTQSHAFNQSIFSGSSGTKPWAVSPQGQADNIRTIAEKLAALPNNNGYGIFYWEPAWLPVSGAGWAGSGTIPTWADQALFSYKGTALPSLQTFARLTA